jgi:hypothetical protein
VSCTLCAHVPNLTPGFDCANTGAVGEARAWPETRVPPPPTHPNIPPHATHPLPRRLRRLATYVQTKLRWLRAVTSGTALRQPPNPLINNLSTLGGTRVTVFAQDSMQQTDIYSQLLAPYYSANVFAQTWKRGKGAQRCPLRVSACGGGSRSSRGIRASFRGCRARAFTAPSFP